MNRKRLPKYPIYIPSKNRSDNLLTAKLFDRDGVPYQIVVEPSQVETYTKNGYGDRLLVLPEDNRGLVYSRNWITEYSVKRGEARHWQIDDDIRYITRCYRSTMIRCDAGAAIRICEDFADRYENVALLSLNSVFFIGEKKGYRYSSKIPPFYLNHRCYTFILFLNALPNRWRPPNNEDADMTLQVLADGWCTVLMNAFSMQTPTTMMQKGGQTEKFIAGSRLKMVRALERRWPGVVTVDRRFGHPQHFIRDNWRGFDTQLKLKKEFQGLKGNDEQGLYIKALAPVKSKRLREILNSQGAQRAK